MKLYNQNTDKVQDYKVIKTSEGIRFTSKLSDAELNAQGYYRLVFSSAPSRRYYTSTKTYSLVNNEYTQAYATTDNPLDQVKEAMLKDLKIAFANYSERPRVDSGLGYFVDGSRTDLQNFEIGRDLAFPFIVDADDIEHPAVTADYDAVIQSIKEAGALLFQTRRTKKAEINLLSSVTECVLYEATPEDVMVDIIDEITMLPTGSQELKTLYKNNVKEW